MAPELGGFLAGFSNWGLEAMFSMKFNQRTIRIVWAFFNDVHPGRVMTQVEAASTGHSCMVYTVLHEA